MPADRPYQSHLLSFLNRQVQAAKDRTGVIWRTVKLSVSTALSIGIQGILYPFYAVMKAAELVGKQIGQAEGMAGLWLRSGLAPLTDEAEPLASDAPFTTVLTALHQRQLATTSVGNADELTLVLASETAIQGFATRLSDRRLVLVTPKQTVLDVLSDAQAAEILKRIRYEVAMYFRWVRSRQLKADRRFWELAAHGSMARALQSSRVESSRVEKTEKAEKAELQVSPIRIPTLWQKTSPLGFFALPNLQDLPSLQALPELLQAAFKYFFGRPLLGHSHPFIQPSAQPQLEGFDSRIEIGLIEDPWLTPDDLFESNLNLRSTPATSLTAQTLVLQPNPTPNLPLLPAQPADIPLQSAIARFIQAFWLSFTQPIAPPNLPIQLPVDLPVHRPRKSTSLATQAIGQATIQSIKSKPKTISTPPRSHAPTLPLPTAATGHLIENFNCTPTFAPDWLEANTEDLGYDRSWFDRCIAGLDWLLVKIEQLFLTIWTTLRTLFQSR